MTFLKFHLKMSSGFFRYFLQLQTFHLAIKCVPSLHRPYAKWTNCFSWFVDLVKKKTSLHILFFFEGCFIPQFEVQYLFAAGSMFFIFTFFIGWFVILTKWRHVVVCGLQDVACVMAANVYLNTACPPPLPRQTKVPAYHDIQRVLEVTRTCLPLHQKCYFIYVSHQFSVSTTCNLKCVCSHIDHRACSS